MATTRRFARIAAGLTLGVAIAVPTAAWAQGRSNLPSGSGSGTGTGSESGSGLGTTGTGAESGGPGSTGTGLESGALNRRGGSGYGGRAGSENTDGAPGGAPSRRRPGMPNRSRTGVGVGAVGGDRSPSDPSLIDLIGSQELGELSTAKSLSSVDLKRLHELLLQRVRRLSDPGERSLAMLRIARSEIFGSEFLDSRKTLKEAGETALTIGDSTIRDIRIVGIVTTMLALAESENRESKRIGEAMSPRPSESKYPGNEGPKSEPPLLYGILRSLTGSQWPPVPRPPMQETRPTSPAPVIEVYPTVDRERFSKNAMYNWDYAAWLSTKLANPDYRSDTLFRVVDSEALASEEMALELELLDSRWNAARYALEELLDNQVVLNDPVVSKRARDVKTALAAVQRSDEMQADPAAPKRYQALSRAIESLYEYLITLSDLDSPIELLDLKKALAAPRRLMDSKRSARMLVGNADRMLARASIHAHYILIPQWRDQALLAIVNRASASDQFFRGLMISRSIPRSEIRTDALVLIAEGQARSDYEKDASITYEEAARAVASIPLDDPRATLNGVLVDSLISVGRFDDARACVGLYPDAPRRMAALGAIAQSMGKRGLADDARGWINRDIAPADRSQLLRRVLDGVLSGAEQSRSQTSPEAGD